MRADEQEIFDRAHRIHELGILDDLDEIMVLLDVNATADIGVTVDLGSEIKYAFFRTAGGTITTSDPELIARALKRMRMLMVLDDLADV